MKNQAVEAKNTMCLVDIGLEGEIQRKIYKVVNFHFKPQKLGPQTSEMNSWLNSDTFRPP